MQRHELERRRANDSGEVDDRAAGVRAGSTKDGADDGAN